MSVGDARDPRNHLLQRRGDADPVQEPREAISSEAESQEVQDLAAGEQTDEVFYILVSEGTVWKRGCGTKSHAEEVGVRTIDSGSQVVEDICAGTAVIVQAVALAVVPRHDGRRDAFTHPSVSFLARADETPLIEAEIVDSGLARGK